MAVGNTNFTLPGYHVSQTLKQLSDFADTKK